MRETTNAGAIYNGESACLRGDISRGISPLLDYRITVRVLGDIDRGRQKHTREEEGRRGARKEGDALETHARVLNDQ